MGVKALAAAAVPVFNSNDEGGVVLVTSSIAGRSIGGSSMAYSVTKAAQLHLVKCVAKTQGRKVRCNAVLPGLLLTEWGLEYGEEKIGALKEAAAREDVNLMPAIVAAARDYVTMGEMCDAWREVWGTWREQPVF